MTNKYTVIIDTRERKPLSFKDADRCAATVVKKLDTGDYTILGHETKLCIERKASVEEIAQNVCQTRFFDELERMKAFEHKFIICEFSLYDIISFPLNRYVSKAVQKTTKMTGPFILKKLIEIEIEYNVHIIYCGNRINSVSYIDSIFKRIMDKK